MSKFIPNSYQTPNAYIDEYMAFLTPEEWKVLSYMSRRIFGFNKRQDRISLTQFTSGIQSVAGERLDYGTGLSRPTVIKALAALVVVGVVVEVGDRGSTDGQCYELELEADKVNLDQLMSRKTARHASSQKRTARARAVNGIDRSKADLPQSMALTAVRSMPLTDCGQCDLPIAVNAIDTHGNRGKPVEKQEEEEAREIISHAATTAAKLCNLPDRMSKPQAANLGVLVEFLQANDVPVEKLAAFAAWWQTKSYPARQAAKERRQVSPPSPSQVVKFWPEFDTPAPADVYAAYQAPVRAAPDLNEPPAGPSIAAEYRQRQAARQAALAT